MNTIYSTYISLNRERELKLAFKESVRDVDSGINCVSNSVYDEVENKLNRIKFTKLRI